MSSILFFASLCVPLIFPAISGGQEQPTPTPVGIVAIQGGDNMGRVQLLTMAEIIDRTGIRAWSDARVTGNGVPVGVLDQAFGDLLSFEATSGKSVSLMPGGDKNTYSEDAVTHGTDVLTVINAIAPGAELYACRYTTFDQYVGCIDWFISSGVKIINHSAGVPALPLDGTNIWAREVDRAARSGILWINAAGNFAQGYISDFFTDTNLNTYHEFRGSGINESLSVNPIGASYGRVMLSWKGTEQYAANAIDFDLEVIDVGGNIIADSRQSQQGNPGEIALEWTQVQMSQPFGVHMRNVDGHGEQVQFVLFIEFALLPGGMGRESVIAPGDSLNALTIGALQSYQVAPYSSRGPLVSGAIKPDLVAPGELLLPNGRTFVGTSAAAPVVSGVAALIWEANPSWAREQIFQYLREATQDDSDLPGPDSNYGMGRLYLSPPLTGALATPTLTPPPVIQTPIPAPSKTLAVTSAFLPEGTSNLSWEPVVETVDGVDMVLVPAGCFPMGSTEQQIDEAFQQCMQDYPGCKREWFENQLYQHTVCIEESFWIDRYEVSNAQFAAFNGRAGRESYWLDGNHPREKITWFEARDFCANRGARLPTEAEWEYVARGPEGWVFPWGNNFISENAINLATSGAMTAEVGSRPNGMSWVGAADMSGNVWEWVSSLYQPYPYKSNDGRENDNDTMGERIVRGGSWDGIGWSGMIVTYRFKNSAIFEANSVGFRCVRTG